MLRQPRTISPATKRRWRFYEWVIALTISGGVAWIVFAAEPNDPRPVYIDVAYPLEGYQCPADYDGPEPVADNVVRCTLHAGAR